MTPHLLWSLKPVHTQFTHYDFNGGGQDRLGKILLNREFQLIGCKSFFIFIKANSSNDYLFIYMHFFGGNLPGCH